jgi:hypothetical protein
LRSIKANGKVTIGTLFHEAQRRRFKLWEVVTSVAESLELEVADDAEASDNALSCLRAMWKAGI